MKVEPKTLVEWTLKFRLRKEMNVLFIGASYVPPNL